MKTLSEPAVAVINPTIVILGLLAAAVIFLALKSTSLPLLSNPKIDLAIIVLLGMAICAQGGIGRVAATGQWLNPLSFIGYLLGGLILLITLAVFVGWKLPYIQNDQQAIIAVAILAGLNVVNAVTHYLLVRG